MATRGKKRALSERSRKHHRKTLTGRSGTSPTTEREKRIWRHGLLKGSAITEERVLNALQEVGLKVTQFGDRLKFRGVEAEPPEEFSDTHPMASFRRRS